MFVKLTFNGFEGFLQLTLLAAATYHARTGFLPGNNQTRGGEDFTFEGDHATGGGQIGYHAAGGGTVFDNDNLPEQKINHRAVIG